MNLDDYMEFIPLMNEQVNPSKFAHEISVNDTPQGNFSMKKEFERVLSLILSESYQGAFLEADRLFKTTQPIKDHYIPVQYEEFLELRKAAFYYAKVCDQPEVDFETIKPTFEFRKKHNLSETPNCQ